jgi:hypothetical protein
MEERGECLGGGGGGYYCKKGMGEEWNQSRINMYSMFDILFM